ncbi:MAG: hypothetical protein Q8M76_13340 [Spirochaetaceae bacterium]|nr:hypothetical protein [Spirochaetaceae bacterium]
MKKTRTQVHRIPIAAIVAALSFGDLAGAHAQARFLSEQAARA